MNPFVRPGVALAKAEVRAEASLSTAGGVATLRIYDPIDSWGGPWGLSAKEFVAILDALPEGITEIRLLINSPGGEVMEGLAIINALRAHSARVVAVVEGLAASMASVIAASADELVMMRNSLLYVHRGSMGMFGNADDFTWAIDLLTKLDRNVVDIYQAKAGGTTEEWLAVMSAETMYTADEAVAAGLADRLDQAPADEAVASARARFDLSSLDRASRVVASAPLAPEPPATEPGSTNRKESAMSLETLMAGLRERLGITDANADEEVLLAGLDQALTEQAEPTVTAPAGAVLVDEQALSDLRAQAALGVAAHERQVESDRVSAVDAAIAEGRIPVARRDHWLAQMRADDEGARATLAALAPNTIPVAEIGHAGGVEASADDALYAKAWGEEG